MHAPKKILVPLDFSDSSKAALRYAEAVAQRFDSIIDVLHVCEQPPSFFPNILLQVAGRPTRSVRETVRREALEELMEFVADTLGPARERAVEIHVEAKVGDPTEQIVRRATAGQYDLVVMGTKGRAGLAQMLMGSVAEGVVRQAPCPVLTIRQQAVDDALSVPAA